MVWYESVPALSLGAGGRHRYPSRSLPLQFLSEPVHRRLYEPTLWDAWMVHRLKEHARVAADALGVAEHLSDASGGVLPDERKERIAVDGVGWNAEIKERGSVVLPAPAGGNAAPGR